MAFRTGCLERCRAKARAGMGVAEACRMVRGDAWRWSPGFYGV